MRHAAAAAATEAEFFDRLQQAGVIVKLRHSQHDNSQVTGYAVALPDATTAAGDPVFYSGGKLAPDLSLPRLRHRWQQATDPGWSMPTNAAARGQAYAYAAEQIRTATGQMKTGSLTDDGEADAAAMAAADVLTVTARTMEGRTAWTAVPRCRDTRPGRAPSLRPAAPEHQPHASGCGLFPG